VRTFVVLLTLGVIGYGLSCMVRGRLVSEGITLEGVPARIVGAGVAGLAGIALVRSIYRWRRTR
jgi:hypothetical protein